MPPSKATLYNRQSDLKRLNQQIPADCPLTVTHDDRQYVVTVRNTNWTVEPFKGRYEVVWAFLMGYLAAWNDQI